MLHDLVSDACGKAERSAPAVRAAALFHLARVLTKIDAADAPRVLEQGLALAATLPAEDREILLGEGAALAATVSPQRALSLVRDRDATETRREAWPRALFNIIDHGHVADAVAYLSEPVAGEAYPFHAAYQAMGHCGDDDDARLRVFRSAIRAMRDEQSAGRRSPYEPNRFVHLFTVHWRRLPADEARDVVRELVRSIRSERDAYGNSSFAAGPHRVQFSSMHEQRLFELLGPLRHLDPNLAASVVKDYPDLSAAAERFPYGRESMTSAMLATPTPAVPRLVVEMPASDFEKQFAAALNMYAEESDPKHFNVAPKVCWWSSVDFRVLLYEAGRGEGAAAERHLHRIPDAALRLFAQIELAAALAGLPPIGGWSIRQAPFDSDQGRPRRATIRA